MVTGFLVDTLILSDGSVWSTPSTSLEGDIGNEIARDWVKNKHKASASLFRELASKAAAAFPGIIGSIVHYWNCWLEQRKPWGGYIWALVVGIGGLIYTY